MSLFSADVTRGAPLREFQEFARLRRARPELLAQTFMLSAGSRRAEQAGGPRPWPMYRNWLALLARCERLRPENCHSSSDASLWK